MYKVSQAGKLNMYKVSQQVASYVQGLTAGGFTECHKVSKQVASYVQSLTAGGFK